VQGEAAPAALVAALEAAARAGNCDLLILTRGGGSLEDLAAFNDEGLARTIAALEIPLISAVGHEIDFTIADFVADQRAPTPSAAAELAAPAARELDDRFAALAARLARAFGHRLTGWRRTLADLARRQALAHPQRRLGQQAQRVDELDLRLQRAVRTRLRDARRRCSTVGRRLVVVSPAASLARAGERLALARQRLGRVVERRLAQHGQALAALARNLHAVSPLGTLARGYAIARRHDDAAIVHSSEEAPAGTRLDVTLSRGSLVCLVKETHE